MKIALRRSLRARASHLRYGLLVVPGSLALAIVALGVILSTVEHHVGHRGFNIIFSGDAQSARSTLTVLGEGIATILSISMSITIVALQLVSQQFSPRALRNFMADRVTQVTAGTLAGTVGYALVVLRVTYNRSGSRGGFVPTASVSLGILLGLASLGVLLVFFHHMARTVQLEEIAADIAHNTLRSLKKLYPSPFGGGIEEDPQALLRQWRTEGEPRAVHPKRPGYVERVNIGSLRRLLNGRGARVHIQVYPGDFVSPAQTVAELYGIGGPGDVEDVVQAAIHVASARDLDEDTLYGVRQLADIAIKAISPAVNDPTTAVTSLEYITSILEALAVRALPSEVRREGDGSSQLVVIARRVPFEQYVNVGFLQVGRHAARDLRVVKALLFGLAEVARAAAEAGAEERLAVLLETAHSIVDQAKRVVSAEPDRAEIDEAVRQVEVVAAPAGPGCASI